LDKPHEWLIEHDAKRQHQQTAYHEAKQRFEQTRQHFEQQKQALDQLNISINTHRGISSRLMSKFKTG
jgi:L-rhamnose isomerase